MADRNNELLALYQISHGLAARAMLYNIAMNSNTLIMLHGWGMPSSVFADWLPWLEAHGQVVSPALPGYPGSPWQHDDNFESQLETMARDLPAGHLLGWSLGGLYAIELANRFPQRFSALTLVASNPCFVKRPDWDCAVDAAVFEQFTRELSTDWRRCMRRFLALQMQGERQARSLSRDLWRRIVDAGEPGLEVLEFGLELLSRKDARVALGQIKQPLRLVLGEQDKLVPLSLERQICELNRGIAVESVAGAAHAPFLSHPKQVAALI